MINKEIAKNDIKDALNTGELKSAYLWIQADEDAVIVHGLYETSGLEYLESLLYQDLFKLSELNEIVDILIDAGVKDVHLIDESLADFDFDIFKHTSEIAKKHEDFIQVYEMRV